MDAYLFMRCRVRTGGKMTGYAMRIPTPPRMMSEAEQAALLTLTGQRRDGFRDHMLLALALATGLREHELVALDVGDLVDAAGKVRPKIYLRVFKRSAKKPALQECLLSETIRIKLGRFLTWKKSHGQSIAPEAPLFMSKKGNRLSTRQVRHLFHVWQERAGFEKAYSFHSARHSACSNLYRKTKDIRVVQRFARHVSIETTMRYSHPDEATLLRAIQDLPC
jgi:site-specific recombinase XerD